MLQKKICMLGSFAVGKTSLVRRYVESIYSDVYHTTVGVKIDKKTVQVGEQEVGLVLWDLYGEDEFQKMRWSYVRGASGYLLVADGTRRATLRKSAVARRRRFGKPSVPCPLFSCSTRPTFRHRGKLTRACKAISPPKAGT